MAPWHIARPVSTSLNLMVWTYLVGFVEERLHAFGKAANDAERIAQHIETENDDVQLLQELILVVTADFGGQSSDRVSILGSFVISQTSNKPAIMDLPASSHSACIMSYRKMTSCTSATFNVRSKNATSG